MTFIEEPPLIVSFARRTTNLNETEFVKFSKTEGWEFTKTTLRPSLAIRHLVSNAGTRNKLLLIDFYRNM